MFSSVARREMPIDSNIRQMRRSSKASRPRRSARTTQIWEKRRAPGVTRKSAASGPIFQGMVPETPIVLVMLEDQNTRLGTEAAGESRALIEDGMAVALFIGRDAGVGGDADDGTGQDDLQSEGIERGV